MAKDEHNLEDIIDEFPDDDFPNDFEDLEEITENDEDFNDDSLNENEEYDDIDDDDNEEEDISLNKILKTEIVQSKFNKEFTSEIVVSNLTESFVVLSNLLEEGRLAKDNVDKLFDSLDKLKNIVENMKESANKMNNINQIIDVINTLVRVLSANNKNIDDVIKILHEIAKKQKSLEDDIEMIKVDKFISDDDSSKGTSNSSNINIILYINTFLIAILIVFTFLNHFS